MTRRSVCVAVAASVVLTTNLLGQDTGTTVTKHTSRADSGLLTYTVQAGRLPIRAVDAEEPRGHMFYVAYRMPSKPGGAAAAHVSLGWRAELVGAGHTFHVWTQAHRGKTVDYDLTLLTVSDLVFVDPIGTGFSRPAKAEWGKEFYGVLGDQASVAEFIRAWRALFDPADSPLFLYGVSYGTWRASGVAEILERNGTRVAGVVLQSGGIQLGPDALPRELRIAHRTPGRAERTEVADGLARCTGLNAANVDRKTLAIAMPQFSEQLLRDRDLIVGRYDSRLTGKFDIQQTKMYDPTKDPSLEDLISDAAIVRYFRSELKYENDLQYQGPFGGGYPPATSFRGDWMSVRWNFKAVHDVEQPLVRAMTTNPSLRVLSSCGYYDLVCSYFANEQLASRLDPALRSRVVVHNYAGAHAVYTDDGVRTALKRDTARFIQNSNAKR